MHSWLILTMICLFFWGVSGVTQKTSTNYAASDFCFLWFVYAMIAQSLALLFMGMAQWQISTKDIALCVLGGALNGLGVLTLFAAMAKGGKASVATAIAALYPVVTVTLSILLLKESLSVTQMAGMMIAIVAACLLSIEGKTTDPAAA